MIRILPPLEEIGQYLRYEPETGHFYWRMRIGGRCKMGSPAGYLVSSGHREIIFRSKKYSLHRLAWLYGHGEDPGKMQIDHINGNPDDNRLTNLRLATQSENNKNQRKRKDCSSKLKGARWYKRHQKWCSGIKVNGREVHLGYFDTELEAHQAYCEAAKKYHGEFARFG